MSKTAKRPAAPKTNVSAWQKVRMLAAAKAVASGEKKFDLACRHCGSTSLYDEADELHAFAAAMRQRPGQDRVQIPDRGVRKGEVLTCVSCGRRTSMKNAHVIRRAKIKAFIEAGIDPPTSRSST
jgi:hypothetical protein